MSDQGNINSSKLNNALPRNRGWVALSYSQKFTVITLIFILPLLAFAPIVYEQILRIDRYGLKEAQGVLYLRDIWTLTASLQNYSTTDSNLGNNAATQQDLTSAREEVSENIQQLQSQNSTAESLELSFSANNVADQWSIVKTPEEINSLLENMFIATQEVGDKSYLILDPDLDTYYLMDAVLLKLPENQSSLFKIKLLLSKREANNKLSLEDESELRNHLSIVTQNLEGLTRDLNVAARNNANQAMSPLINDKFNIYKDNIDTYVAFAQSTLSGKAVTENANDLNSLFLLTENSSEEFYLAASKGLEQGIQNRISSYSLRIVIYLTLSILSLGAAFIIGNRLMRSISIPLQKAISAAENFASGNLTTRIEHASTDEAGRVIQAFNRLAIEIETSQNALKKQSEDLTDKTLKLETISKVAREITSIRDLPSVLTTATNLVHENFGYYHVGIFLLDERKEYAVLAATNSEGGQKMLERGHQLKTGETGIVGYVADSLQARIALDVGNDAVYFNNPDLPQTRSELALPLVVSGQILGVIDVQSTQPMAFKQEDVAILQILAEQLAIAIQNAKLFNEAEKALESASLAFGELSREAWSKILNSQPRINYISTQPATVEIQNDHIEPSLAKAFETGDLILGTDGVTISIPIKIRGQAIGAIRLKKSEISEAWTQEETNLAIALSDQLSGALESARLYKESQQRAAREATVSDISARISSVSQVDAILRETVQELGQVLKNTSVTFQLLDQASGQVPAKDTQRSVNRPAER